MVGKLFLIPSYLSDENDASFIAPVVLEIVKNTSHYLVENIRTARRFISSLKTGIVIDELEFSILDKRANWDIINELFQPIRQGKDMAIISEAGLPCLADPGGIAVSYAHQFGYKVVPLPGASSIQTALVTSGFNGQLFTFNGYLPIDKVQRIKKIRELEQLANKGHSQIFMETPYRNKSLIDSILKTCNPNTHLCIASDIFGGNEKIITASIKKWKTIKHDFHKIPTVFVFGQPL